MKCQFCGNKEATKELLDGETLCPVDVCDDCAKETQGVDEVIDNQIEDLQLQRVGIQF